MASWLRREAMRRCSRAMFEGLQSARLRRRAPRCHVHVYENWHGLLRLRPKGLAPCLLVRALSFTVHHS